MIEDLKAQIKKVHEARLKAAEARSEIVRLREKWEDTMTPKMDVAQELYIARDAAEAILKVMTLKAYEETKSKTPAPGVGIREASRLAYSDRLAFGWAVEHQMALQLDKKEFEKIARATPLDFVHIEMEPQATIATDLTEAVKALEQP